MTRNLGSGCGLVLGHQASVFNPPRWRPKLVPSRGNRSAAGVKTVISRRERLPSSDFIRGVRVDRSPRRRWISPHTSCPFSLQVASTTCHQMIGEAGAALEIFQVVGPTSLSSLQWPSKFAAWSSKAMSDFVSNDWTPFRRSSPRSSALGREGRLHNAGGKDDFISCWCCRSSTGGASLPHSVRSPACQFFFVFLFYQRR